MPGIAELLEEIAGPQRESPAYQAKMLHRVPTAPSVDRELFILERCTGKIVLNLGTTDPLHRAIVSVATSVIGADKARRLDCRDFILMDFDELVPGTIDFPLRGEVDLIVCGEVLEHLGNPLNFLRSLRRYACPMIVTVPNAFAAVNASIPPGGRENVHVDHVAWYSPHTLAVLLRRAAWTIQTFAWYRGKPNIAEGMIAVVV